MADSSGPTVPPSTLAARNRELLQYRDGALNLAYRLCGNSHDAEDIFQEAYLRALRAPHAAPAGTELRNWFLQIVTHAARDHQRSTSSRRVRERRATEHIEPAMPAALRAEEAELKRRVERELAQLDAKFRVPLALHYEQGLTFEEASGVLGIPAVTLRVHASRGISELRARLSRSGVLATAKAIVAVMGAGLCVKVSSALAASCEAAASTPALSSAATSKAALPKVGLKTAHAAAKLKTTAAMGAAIPLGGAAIVLAVAAYFVLPRNGTKPAAGSAPAATVAAPVPVAPARMLAHWTFDAIGQDPSLVLPAPDAACQHPLQFRKEKWPCDLRTPPGTGPSGKPGDRAFAANILSIPQTETGYNGQAFLSNPQADLAWRKFESLTITCWLKTAKPPEKSVRLLYWGGDESIEIWFPWTGGIPSLKLRGARDAEPPRFDAGAQLITSADADHWVFMAMTYRGGVERDGVRFYRGTAASRTMPLAMNGLGDTTAIGSIENTGEGNFVLGNIQRLDRNFPGQIDDFRIYAVALDPAEIEAVRCEALPKSIGFEVKRPVGRVLQNSQN